MAEVFGAAASALALAGIAAEIANLIKNLTSTVLHMPGKVAQWNVQIEQLIDIAELIQGNACLQTPLLQSITSDCRKDAEKLRSLFASLDPLATSGVGKRYWKAISGIANEKRILDTFKKLEEDKSALALCIASIDS
jgi:hypothetical protein